MSDTAVFGEAIFGEAIFGSYGPIVQETYTSLSAFHAAVELVDETSFLNAFTYIEPGTNLEKIVLVRRS